MQSVYLCMHLVEGLLEEGPSSPLWEQVMAQLIWDFKENTHATIWGMTRHIVQPCCLACRDSFQITSSLKLMILSIMLFARRANIHHTWHNLASDIAWWRHVWKCCDWQGWHSHICGSVSQGYRMACSNIWLGRGLVRCQCHVSLIWIFTRIVSLPRWPDYTKYIIRLTVKCTEYKPIGYCIPDLWPLCMLHRCANN